MQAYKLTIQQANLLTGKEISNGWYYNPVKDINGDYFISTEEVDQTFDPSLLWIKTLEKEEFTFPPNEEPGL